MPSSAGRLGISRGLGAANREPSLPSCVRRRRQRPMRESDEVWTTLRPLMRVEDDATFIALRDGFVPAFLQRRWERRSRQRAKCSTSPRPRGQGAGGRREDDRGGYILAQGHGSVRGRAGDPFMTAQWPGQLRVMHCA